MALEAESIWSEPKRGRNLEQKPGVAAPPNCLWGRIAGFSLVELLVVLMLLAILAALAAPVGSKLLNSLAFQRQTRQIMASLRYARLMAITSGKPVEVRLDGSREHGLIFSGGVKEERELELTATDTLSMKPEVAAFFPEGMATPATLILNTETRKSTILIDALTGLPQIQR